MQSLLHHLSFIKKLTNATIIQLRKKTEIRMCKTTKSAMIRMLARSSVSSCLCRLLE